jgi:hypothetical protein
MHRGDLVGARRTDVYSLLEFTIDGRGVPGLWATASQHTLVNH